MHEQQRAGTKADICAREHMLAMLSPGPDMLRDIPPLQESITQQLAQDNRTLAYYYGKINKLDNTIALFQGCGGDSTGPSNMTITTADFILNPGGESSRRPLLIEGTLPQLGPGTSHPSDLTATHAR